MCRLPQLIYDSLTDQDWFGLRYIKPVKKGVIKEDVVKLEQKELNQQIKDLSLTEFAENAGIEYRANRERNDCRKQAEKIFTDALNEMESRPQFVDYTFTDGHQVKGPTKWLIYILGPKRLMETFDQLKESYHTNIVVLLVNNETEMSRMDKKRNEDKRKEQEKKLKEIMLSKRKTMLTGLIKENIKEALKEDMVKVSKELKLQKVDLESDTLTMEDFDGNKANFLNSLARRSPEGYLQLIDEDMLKGTNIKRFEKSEANAVFDKVIASMELHKADNIPFVAEVIDF